MYLSRIPIDIKKQRAMQALDNPEIIHGMIENCFTGERQRNLWRIDELNGQTYLMVLSQTETDFTPVMNQIGTLNLKWETKDYKPLLNRIKRETVWHFRLVANPIMSVKGKDEARGKVKAITIAEHQKGWLIRQGEKHGFSIEPRQLDVIRSEWRTFRNKGKNITTLQATFEGILTVTDAELFIKALQDGIGREKAYGFGMLTVVSYE